MYKSFKKSLSISNEDGEKYTERQWAKKFIGILAQKNANDINDLLKEFEPEEAELIYREFHDIIRLMTTRRGFQNYPL